MQEMNKPFTFDELESIFNRASYQEAQLHADDLRDRQNPPVVIRGQDGTTHHHPGYSTHTQASIKRHCYMQIAQAVGCLMAVNLQPVLRRANQIGRAHV